MALPFTACATAAPVSVGERSGPAGTRIRVRVRAVWLLLAWLPFGPAVAAAPPDAVEIARQVDYVNRFAAVRNVSYGDREQHVLVLDRSASGRLLRNSFERWRRNDYPDGAVAARDLAIFRSGKLSGTGILVTDYRDPEQGRSYAVWLPSLRKVRRFSEPDPADSWGNSNFSYGDIYIRRPEDEVHELLGRETFDACLGVLQLPAEQRDRHMAALPAADCSVQGRAVYRLCSRPRRTDLGYDQRLVWVDAETFADYRSEYYLAGQRVKVIDKSWHGMGLADPRAQYWSYWYARTEATGQEGMAFVPPGAVRWNADLEPDLWSERTLRQIKR
jgi:hypothetical protein